MTTPSSPASFTVDELKAFALALGFVACGIADLSPTPHGDVLDRWLASGYGGVMRYLNRQAKKRKDPRRIDQRGKSAVVVIDNYYYPDIAEGKRFKVARYARGQDYHIATMRRLELLADWLLARGATWARPFADAGPVPERELAQRAGLGWIGKNTMLLRPGVGSWFVIGSVINDLQLPVDPQFETDHCGSCTRCLDACPTQAFIEPRMLDATRCLSYQTIEHRGTIPTGIQSRMEGWIFGCDICNEVCPWNQRFAAPSAVVDFAPRHPVDLNDPDCFERLSQDEFDTLFADTALARPGLDRMRRNVRAASSQAEAPAPATGLAPSPGGPQPI
jgi:epoxyqueuosine reductase